MQPTIMKLMTGAILLVCLSAAGSTAGAEVLFDDHFTGNSGGIPTGWILGYSTGSAVEAGTTVSFTGEIAIGTDSAVDPNKGTDTLTISIARTDWTVDFLGTGFAASDLTHMLLVGFRPGGDLRLEINASDTWGETWQTCSLTALTGYTCGPLTLTLILGPSAFCVSSDSPAYSSGFIAYSTAFPAFTRSDLGNACRLVLSHAGGSLGVTSDIDRLRLATDSPTPTRSHTFGQLKVRYR